MAGRGDDTVLQPLQRHAERAAGQRRRFGGAIGVHAALRQLSPDQSLVQRREANDLRSVGRMRVVRGEPAATTAARSSGAGWRSAMRPWSNHTRCRRGGGSRRSASVVVGAGRGASAPAVAPSPDVDGSAAAGTGSMEHPPAISRLCPPGYLRLAVQTLAGVVPVERLRPAAELLRSLRSGARDARTVLLERDDFANNYTAWLNSGKGNPGRRPVCRALPDRFHHRSAAGNGPHVRGLGKGAAVPA